MTDQNWKTHLLATALALSLVPAPVLAEEPVASDASSELAVETPTEEDPSERGEAMAELEARAHAHETAGEHVDAARLWTELVHHAEADADTRQQAVYEAQGAYRLAYHKDKDPAHLCEGWRVVDGYLKGNMAEFAGARERAEEFRGYADGIRAQLDRHRTERGPIPCPELFAPSEPAPAAAVAPASADPTPQPDLKPKPPEPAARPAADDRPPRPGRGLIIAGSVALVASAGLFGVMGYGIHGTVTRRDEIVAIGDLARAEGRPLTVSEHARVEQFYADGSKLETLAIATGATGGAALIVGITLVAVGKKRGKRGQTALLPTITRDGAGLSLTGRF